jgi:diguanylate cyclase (GGDEF)-like protein
MAVERSRTLAHEVTDAFRIVIASAIAMVVVIAAAIAWFALSGGPQIDRSAKAVTLSRDASAQLLDQQSMLRAYVVTGDPSILATYQSVRAQIDADYTQLQSNVGSAESSALVQQFGTAELAWQSGWAATAADPSTHDGLLASDNEDLRPALVRDFVRSGNATFGDAQQAARDLVVQSTAAQVHARHAAFVVVALTAALLLMIGAATAVAALSRRRTINARVVGPIGVLLDKVQAVGRGEFGPSPVLDAPQELLALRDELADMSASLKLQQQVLGSRADEAASSARRMKLVVDFAREISDSLTLSNVLGAVTSASRRLVESPRARVWLYDEEARNLRLRYDSITGDAVPKTLHQMGEGALGRTAQDHRVSYAGGMTGESDLSAKSLAVAVPLVKGTRLIGVLEIALRPGATWLDTKTIDVLTATAGHAATAIHAAQLYAQSEELSRSDPLTGLGNRRQLDADLELEVERAARYQRPMSFLMIDIDHFKAVNDTFGHALGDTVLVEVGEVLRSHMRVGDTAYRYGGEEFAVLARETDGLGGRVIAERLRKAIEARYAARRDDEVAVTISVGLVTISSDVDDATTLVSAADRALYDAKRSGRNCVRTARVEAENPDTDAQMCALG